MSQRYTSINPHLRKAPAFAQPIIEHLREVVHAGCPEVMKFAGWQRLNAEYAKQFAGIMAPRE